MKTKICSKCKQDKPINEFHKDRPRKDGLTYWCKECIKEYQKNWRENNPEKRREYNKKWRENNSKYTKEYDKKYYQKHIKKIKKHRREYRKNNIYRIWAIATRANHRFKGYKITISNDKLEIIAKQTKYCPICDVKLDWNSEKGILQMNSPTLDRINNEKILTLNNIQIICWKCNTTKLDRDFKEFIEYCTMISNKFNQI